MSNRTDTERLDFLQQWLDQAEYTGHVVLRPRRRGGWALHETQRFTAVRDVREAIDKVMDRRQEVET